MPYTLIQPGMFDGLDSDCIFAIPPLNDNMRKLDILQSAVALFPTPNIFRPGDIAYLHPAATRWEARNTPTEWGCLGAAISPTTAEKNVRVQMIGQAMVRASHTPSASYIGYYLAHGGNIITGPINANTIIGKITGVLDAYHYEVLLHAFPDNMHGVNHLGGVLYYAMSPVNTQVTARFDVKKSTIRWYDDASQVDHGRDNYFDILSGNLIQSYGSWNNNQGASFSLKANLLSGAAQIWTYNHKSYDHSPQYVSYDLRVEFTGSGMYMLLRSQETQDWAQISEFDCDVSVAGWWSA
jgi:hypothetical protein